MYNPTPRNIASGVVEGGSESFFKVPVENQKPSQTTSLSERMVGRLHPGCPRGGWGLVAFSWLSSLSQQKVLEAPRLSERMV